MADRTIPYTHWAYFAGHADAERCRAELAADYLVGIDKSVDGDDWLLRAAREVAIDDLVQRHEEVERVVVRCGGRYDGGESGWLDPNTGEPVRAWEVE